MRTLQIYMGTGALAALIFAGGCKKEEAQEERLDLRPLVKVGRLAPSYDFTEGAAVQGTVRTKYSADVSARVAGSLEEVLADEAQNVKAGDALFQVDKVNIENKVRMAQDDLNVAKALEREAQAALTEAQATQNKAQVDADRMKNLYETSQAVTKDTWERADLNLKSANAVLQRTQAAVESAKTRITQAETALAVAKKTLSDSLGVAPFDGVITVKHKDKGDFVGEGDRVFSMDDPRIYEVCFSMNAVHYSQVTVGETKVRFTDGREETVSYKAPSAHPVTRTFEIRVTVEHTPDMAPGMIRDALVVFRRFNAAAVPSQAVGLRDGRHMVFVVKDGKVHGVPVDNGTEWQGHIEIRKPDALKDADIVVEGMLLLNEDDNVRVEQEQAADKTDAPKTEAPAKDEAKTK